MAAYPVTRSSDIKSNTTNELSDPEKHIISSMWSYFDELEPIFVSGTVKFFKMAAAFSYVTTQQQIWRLKRVLWHGKLLHDKIMKNFLRVFMHLFAIVLAQHTVTWPLHLVLNCCQIKK